MFTTTTSLPADLRRFARTASNGAARYTSRSGALELEQIRSIAPSVFAEAPHASRSSAYAYIPTSEVLTGLMKEGFKPYSVMQGGSRDEEKRGFTKHLIRLRHESTHAVKVNDTFTEIVLLNSHDGTSAYRLMAGMFRLACSNGLVVAQSTIEDIRIPHKGDITGLVIDGCVELMTKLPELSESVREMSALTLSPQEQAAFARAALVARYEDKAPPIQAEQLLTVRRNEDAAPSVWNTFNRIQENVVKGGLRYVQRDEQTQRVKARRQTREIGGIDQNTTVNRALWALAEEMRKIKANA